MKGWRERCIGISNIGGSVVSDFLRFFSKRKSPICVSNDVEVGPPSNKLQWLLNGHKTYDIKDFERNRMISISSEVPICYNHFIKRLHELYNIS